MPQAEKDVWAGLLKFLKPKIVYDIGANCGQFTRIATRIAHCVYAFEPNPAHFNTLLQMGAVVHQVALGPASLAGYLHVPDHDDGLATLGMPQRFTKWTDVQCQIERLDSYGGWRRLPPPQFIKLDVEGAELGVLQGACELLRQYHPVLLCEYAEINTRQFDYEPVEIDNLLQGLGYFWVDVPPWDRLYVPAL